MKRMLQDIEEEEMGRRQNQYSLQRHIPKPNLVGYPFICTLEELYHGGEKTIQILRRILDEFGNYRCSFKTDVTVKFPAGLGNGESITGPKLGDLKLLKVPEDPDTVYPMHGDAIFVVQECPHNVFERRGSDLWVTKKISLVEVLTNEMITVEAIDKSFITIPHKDPGCVAKVLNEGMPINSNAGLRGSLFIKLEVVFPKNLCFTDEQKNELKKLLNGMDDQIQYLMNEEHGNDQTDHQELMNDEHVNDHQTHQEVLNVEDENDHHSPIDDATE